MIRMNKDAERFVLQDQRPHPVLARSSCPSRVKTTGRGAAQRCLHSRPTSLPVSNTVTRPKRNLSNALSSRIGSGEVLLTELVESEALIPKSWQGDLLAFGDWPFDKVNAIVSAKAT